MRSALHLLSLPIEILVSIFQSLDLRSLLNCRLVSQYLCSVIDGSRVLQYKIELDAAGMDDGIHSSMTVAERLARLKAHQLAWQELDLKEKYVLSINKGVWELRDGIFADAPHPSDETDKRRVVTFTRFAAPRRGIEKKQWSFEDIGFRVGDFTLDSAQDLFVVVEHQEDVQLDTSGTRSIHLLSLSTGEKHQAAAKPVLSHTIPHIPGIVGWTSQIWISGSHLCLMCEAHATEGCFSGLTVWNWKTGAVLLTLFGTQIQSFAFLTHRHIMVAIANEHETDHLAIYDLYGHTQPTYILQLPEKSPGINTCNMHIRSDYATSSCDSLDPPVPFSSGRQNSIFVVTMTMIKGFRHVPSFFSLFLPLSTLLPYLTTGEDIGIHVPWTEWGPSGTRLIWDPPWQPFWVRDVQGMKYVHGFRYLSESSTRKTHIRVYDFNLLSLRRAQLSCRREKDKEVIYWDQDEVLEGSETVLTTTRIAGCNVFADTISTCLPYRVTCIRTPDAFDAVLLTEDHLVIVDSNKDQLTVYTL